MNAKLKNGKSISENVIRLVRSLLFNVNSKFVESCTSISVAHISVLAEQTIADNSEEIDETVLDSLAMTLLTKDFQVIPKEARKIN